jgi:glycosyltransferase involved in cell wall biosynthesis
MSRSLNLRLVTPRLEPVTDSGVEIQIEEIGRRLADRGHGVEILTTCARDDVTWKNHYSPGLTAVEGMAVRRFPVDPRLVTRQTIESGWRIARGETTTAGEAEAWLRSRGFSSPLRDHVARETGDIDACIFAPALSGTTLAGLPAAAGGRTLLLAALRDQAPARLEVVANLFRSASSILAGSEAERDMILALYGVPADRVRLLGAAVAPAPEYQPERFRQRHGLEVPFLICAGRRVPAKGVDRLLEYAAALVSDGGLDIRLVLTGAELIDIPPRARNHVLDLHTISRQDKADGMAAALAFCQPAAAEGLALAPMEAWLAGCPVLAEERGAVTASRCRASGGGILYRDVFEFEEAVRLLVERRDLAAEMGRKGKAYVEEKWSWERVITGIEEACAGDDISTPGGNK